jgi:hypothetical protein
LAATAIATINNPATTVLPARLTNSFAVTFLVTRLEFDLVILPDQAQASSII